MSELGGVAFSGIRMIDPKDAPQGVCVFASPHHLTNTRLVWWRFNWSDLLATADRLPFRDHPTVTETGMLRKARAQ